MTNHDLLYVYLLYNLNNILNLCLCIVVNKGTRPEMSRVFGSFNSTTLPPSENTNMYVVIGSWAVYIVAPIQLIFGTIGGVLNLIVLSMCRIVLYQCVSVICTIARVAIPRTFLSALKVTR